MWIRFACGLSIATLCAILSSASPGLAGESSGTPPDIVYKKDGTFFRGTVVERDPKGSVTLQLATGKTIIIPMIDVEYAGPAESAPGRKDAKANDGNDESKSPDAKAPEGEANAAASHIRAHVTGSRPGLRLHVEAARAQAFAVVGNQVAAFTTSMFLPVCDMPCDVPADPGSYRLGVSKGEDGAVVDAGLVNIPNSDVQLDTKYSSRAWVRGLGWVVTLGSLGVGTYMFVDGLGGSHEQCDAQGANCTWVSGTNTTEIIAGTSIALGGMIVGIVMAGTSDKAHVTVRPGASREAGPPGSRGTAKMMPALAIDGAF